MVSTSSPLAVSAGLWALTEGGTAVDAALAADAVLGVVQPFWTGIGGDAFCLIDDGREVVGFNGSGPAPAALTLAACRDAAGGGRALPDTSPLTVTVPGAVDAWSQLSSRYGRLGLARILEPARQLAARGFPVGTKAARAWCDCASRLRPGSPFPGTVRAGQRFANPDQAASLDAIAEGGADAHYRGRWAREAVRAVAAAGGVLSEEDLAEHRGEWVEPIRGTYRGYEVLEHPPNGQGAAVLAALRRRDTEPPGSRRDPNTVAATMVAIREGMRLAHRHVADPRHAEVPQFWTAGDTVYTAVVAGGVGVSLISSVFAQFGSGISAGGVVVQNRGLGFSLDAAHPNVAAPGKRPFHTIIPALVRRDGHLVAVLGVVGGSMQPQGQVQVISHLVDHGLDPQAALDEPRAQWLGRDVIGLEAGFEPEVGDALRTAGFAILDEPMPPEHMGAGQVIRLHEDGWLEGGADPRRDGGAFGR